MIPYQAIFPGAPVPVMKLQIARKTNGIPKGDYRFIECYCTDPDCDCRRTTLVVVDAKEKTRAIICFGFDPDQELAGPFLDDLNKQAPYAPALLEVFVDAVNSSDEWLNGMYQRYRDVRKKISGKVYRGKAFPKPGSIKRIAQEIPAFEDAFDELLQELIEAPQSSKKGKNGTEPNSVATLVDAYMDDALLSDRHYLPNCVRTCLMENDFFGNELATLLVRLTDAEDQDDGRIEAAFSLLKDALELLRIELERKRPDAPRRMELLQNALAQQVYLKSGNPILWATVSQILLESRVDLLPVLYEANRTRTVDEEKIGTLLDTDIASAREGLFKAIASLDTASPFEAFDGLLQMIALTPVEAQTALCSEMLSAENPFIADCALLMLFNPEISVRKAVARLLAENRHPITPESLRRLIICRNWFAEDIRADIDRAVLNARKARIDCAPLPRIKSIAVQASMVDGAGAQLFYCTIPDKKKQTVCSIMLKNGFGIADAFILPMGSYREVKAFFSMAAAEATIISSDLDYLELRVCQALAEGMAANRTPNVWLLQIAELLGTDQWKAVPFDPAATLEELKEELQQHSPKLLTEQAIAATVKESDTWFDRYEFTDSWFEDDAELDAVIEANATGKKQAGSSFFKRSIELADVIVNKILEKRRESWVQRLLLCCLWLKSSSSPPLAWQKLLQLAIAVNDPKRPLLEIPFMIAIAAKSYEAYQGRQRFSKSSN